MAGQGQRLGGLKGLGRSLFLPGPPRDTPDCLRRASSACTPSPGRILATPPPPHSSALHPRREWRLTLGHLGASTPALALTGRPNWLIWPIGGYGGLWERGPQFWVPEPQDPEPVLGRFWKARAQRGEREARGQS